MVVRIAGEEQFRVQQADEQQLHQLDQVALEAIERGDEPGFHSALEAVLDFVRRVGTPLADDNLETSDLILPPADTTLAEATDNFKGEGWLPD